MSTRAEYGIAVFHHIGDVLCCTPIAKQLKATDPNCYITWFTSVPGEVAIRHNPFIDEVIVLEGDQYELDNEIPALAKFKHWTRFFAPAAYLNYEAIPGGSIMHPKGTIFGIVKAGARLNWTVPFEFPFVLTEEEQAEARDFWRRLPEGKKILVETDFRSEQSPWRDGWNDEVVATLRDLRPVFVFTSKERPPFLDHLRMSYPNAYWCNLPFRLNAELFNLCDAFIGVSSGISCLTYSEYCRTDIPRIEVTRGEHWGAAELPQHKNLFLCYSHRKFRESLHRLRGFLVSETVAPDFSPRLEHGTRLRGACPSCGETMTLPTPNENIRNCKSCRAYFNTSSIIPTNNMPMIDCVGSEDVSLPASDFLAANLSAESFDTVTLSGSLGSIEQLQETIEKLQFSLKENGLLCLTTPNIEGVLAASHGKNWKLLNRESNIWFFSPLFIREVLIQAGFWIEHWDTKTTGESLVPLKELIANARPDLKGEELDRFLLEIDRRGGGDIIRVRARKRGGFKGRAANAFTWDGTRKEIINPQPEARGPLVSIVIPCGTDTRYLKDAIRSAAKQTYANVEIIVVDDGRNSETVKIAKELTNEQERPIRCISIPASGCAEARDRGLCEANGGWFVTLDADDELKDSFVARCLDQAMTTSAEVVYSHLEQFGISSRLWDYGAFSPRRVLCGDIPPSTALFRREFYYRFGGYNTGSPFPYSHCHFWLTAVEQNVVVTSVREALVRYRILASGQSHHQANKDWKLLFALYQTLHPKLYSIEELQRAHALIRRQTTKLKPLIDKQQLRFTGMGSLFFWSGLLAEASQRIDTAIRDFARAELLSQDLDWQPGWKKLSLEVQDAQKSPLLLQQLERELGKHLPMISGSAE